MIFFTYKVKHLVMMRVISAKNAKMIKILNFADARKKKKKLGRFRAGRTSLQIEVISGAGYCLANVRNISY